MNDIFENELLMNDAEKRDAGNSSVGFILYCEYLVEMEEQFHKAIFIE